MPVVAVPPLVAALRWRAGASAALLVVAVLAVFTAASGPLFLATADTEVMHAQLEAAGPDQTVITAANPIPAFNSLRSIRGVSKVAHQSGLTNWYGRPTITQDVGFSRFKGNFGDVVSRTGVCGHLQFVSGRCPNGLFQVAITTRDASRLRAKVGSLLAVPGVDQFKVSGIIKVGNLANPYWLGDDFFDYSPQEIHKPPTLDAFFASAATLARLKSLVTIQYPIQVARTGPETASPLRHAESRFAYVMRNTFRLTVSTRLGSALSSYQAQANAVAAIVGVVALQLLLLTLFVLYVLVARTAMARRSEVALAKLRGASLVSLLVMGVAEPTVILLIALPVGFVGAYLAMQVASRVALDGAPVPVTALALVAALAAFASGVVATFAGSRRLLTRQLIDELRSTEDKPSPVARAAWEGAALALAAAGLLELGTAGVLTGSHPNPIALFAPGLIALGIAVPGTRLLPLACAYLVRRTRHSPHVASGLAVRQVIRRPAALRQILILTVAVGLSAFAVIGWSVAGTNRTLRAEFDVGAAQVVKVKVPPSVNLVNAVRQADPSGRYAMAVMESRQPSADLIAMDPTRMAHVPYWSDSVSPAELARLARWLQPKIKPPLILTGDQVRVTADLSATAYPPPDLVVNMLDSGGNAQEADFGYLTPGSHTYVAALPSACTGGCRVQSLTPIWFPSATGPPQVLYTLAISGLADHQRGSWQALDQRVYQSGYWATSSGAIKVSGASQTLTLVVHDTVSQDQPPSVLAAPLPKTLHGVATVASQPNDPVHNAIEDFDGTPLNVNTKPSIRTLPNLGSNGVLISLPTAMAAELEAPVASTTSVWLAPGAPARIMRRLVGEGIRVVSVTTPGPSLQRYNSGGLGLGYQFFVFAAGAAAALAVATTVLTFFLSARRRAFELAVMRALGVAPRVLLRSLVAEQCLVLIPGVILGIVAAVVAALIALPAIPEFGTTVGQPPLQLGLPALPLAVLSVSLLVLLLAAALLAALVAVQELDLARLRMEFR